MSNRQGYFMKTKVLTFGVCTWRRMILWSWEGNGVRVFICACLVQISHFDLFREGPQGFFQNPDNSVRRNSVNLSQKGNILVGVVKTGSGSCNGLVPISEDTAKWLKHRYMQWSVISSMVQAIHYPRKELGGPHIIQSEKSISCHVVKSEAGY